MGYTHYWDRPQSITLETFTAIGQDFEKLLPALERAGVQLANPYGKEFPEIGPDFIGFNGAENCGHAKNAAVCIPWPSATARGTGDNQGIGSTLPFRTCNGDCPMSPSGLNEHSARTRPTRTASTAAPAKPPSAPTILP